MNRQLFLFLVLWIPLVGFSQIQSGEIIYKVKYLDEFENKRIDTIKTKSSTEIRAEQNLSDIFTQRDRAIPLLRFSLIFNQNESVFEHQKNMDVDNGVDLDMGLAPIDAKGVFYTNLEQDLNIHQKEYIKSVRIHSQISDFNWEIIDEFKTIAGYKTQKASLMFM